ncbi:GntR family transcriptional regulator [Rhizobium sp. S152]|uniref:GntR family transcriptional regulator n=1 Tax=Rhizobium sp. S152 TaxID=3055038 RepID=UPI0025A9FF6C|nr:GntR family transcriptional regulator [Rhizobium sp. S152]MDM9628006.1 GntR family transcriptional regulator [Rhizobium sp. S152]
MNDFKRPKSLTSVVADHIRKLIINGDLALGTWLTEREMAASLDVSTTPVREAFSKPQTQGLVTLSPSAGVRVFDMNAAKTRDCTGSERS